jgi:hypothetical protein
MTPSLEEQINKLREENAEKEKALAVKNMLAEEEAKSKKLDKELFNHTTAGKIISVGSNAVKKGFSVVKKEIQRNKNKKSKTTLFSKGKPMKLF